MKENKLLNINDLFNEDIGLKKGDVIDLSSDLTPIALEYRKHRHLFDPNTILDAIEKKVGPDGTICVRTWNWGFCRGEIFNYLTTPSEVGVLGNVALKRAGYKRTKHPIYSFAVWGKYQDLLCDMDNKSAWGNDSPFSFFTDNNGKQLMFGSTMCNSLTHVHYVEEKIGVAYRFLKNFTAPYIDENGVESLKTYCMNVRKLDLDIKMNSEKFAEEFNEKGILKTNYYNNTPISIVNLKEASKVIENDISYNSSRKICKYIGQS